jgi:hypothetical protein
MRLAFLFLCATVGGFASPARAQGSPAPAKITFWDDTANESPIYPVGEAAPVYRAVLDLIYLDGSKRPPVIIMLDSAEGGHMGGPCPFAKCAGNSWTHKSKMDTSTVLAYARATRKRPGLVQFGYPIPIVFISYDDVRRMDADGREILAGRPKPPGIPVPTWGFGIELERKYPKAWGVTILSKVAFNTRHTEALLQAHQWCGDDCRVHETLFLRQTKGRWRVVERIPEEVDPGYSPFGRYLGPVGTTPKESEILPIDRQGVPTEATARTQVYRIVIDSLYSMNGEQPKRIVLTNWFPPAMGVPPHKSAIDSLLLKRFTMLGRIRAPFDAIPKSCFAISTLPVDSVTAFRERGTSLDVDQTGHPFWVAFANKYRDSWGMVGVTRIAFNANRTQALVTTHHACGEDCSNHDTWFLTRSGRAWRIAERIPGDNQPTIELEPLRYLGPDVNPNAYRLRRVQGVVTDYATGNPIPSVVIRIRRMLNSGVNVDDPSIRTDSSGRYTLPRLPLNATMEMIVSCPEAKQAAFSQPMYVTPGMDTTINMAVDFRICDTAVVTPKSAARLGLELDSPRSVVRPASQVDVTDSRRQPFFPHADDDVSELDSVE